MKVPILGVNGFIGHHLTAPAPQESGEFRIFEVAKRRFRL